MIGRNTRQIEQICQIFSSNLEKLPLGSSVLACVMVFLTGVVVLDEAVQQGLCRGLLNVQLKYQIQFAFSNRISQFLG